MPKFELDSIAQVLPGRDTPTSVVNYHAVLGSSLVEPFPAQCETIYLAGGCFWGIEEIFWQYNSLYSTFVGYSGGLTPNPSYQEVCTGRTGHTETVGVVYDPREVSLEDLLITFWEAHDPTQWLRQGGDIGSQYRSAIFTTNPAQQDLARSTAKVYQKALTNQGGGQIATEIEPLNDFYYAEDYHQQYLYKNPHGYRCHGSTGIKYPRTAQLA